MTAALALAVALVTGALRLATFEIGNDDYLHLSVAQQLLLGEVPVRDFIDPGELLFNYTSAAAQALGGHNMRSEVLLDVTALAVAASLAFILAARISRSRFWALVSVGATVLLVPRLYAYPKLLLYPVGLAAIVAYSSRPTLKRLVLAAAVTVVAFLFRHDHGGSIGIAVVAMLVLVHMAEGVMAVARRILAFGAAVGVLLLPFLLFVQMHGGVVSYFGYTAEIARGEYLRTVGDYPAFRGSLAWPRVRVLWTPDVDTTTRQALAARYRLANPESRDDGVWEYDLRGWSSANMAALVADPHVKDTAGFDRRTFVLSAPVEDPNLLAWFYYLTMALAPVALIVGVADARRRPNAAGLDGDTRVLLVAAVLSLVMNLFLMRSASESAVGDVSSITAIVAAALLARGFRSRAPTAGVAAKVGVLVLLLAVSMALIVRGNGGFIVSRAYQGFRDDGLASLTARLDRARALEAPFPNRLARYVNRCTAPTDRLLLTWYAPEIIYGTGRGFAAGRPYFITSFATSDRALAFSLETLERQRVPLVVIGPNYESEFQRAFRAIDEYVRQHYVDLGTDASDDGFRVLADRRLTPVGKYADTALPCFR